MKQSRHKFLRMVLGVAMAALLVLEGTPMIALAQAADEPAQDAVTLSTQASKSIKTIKGTGWKLTLPSYWRKRVRVEKNTYNGQKTYVVYGKNKNCSSYRILTISECNSREIKQFKKNGDNVAMVTYVELKNGKKAHLYRGNDSLMSFIVKVRKGKYLVVSTLNWGLFTQGCSKATVKNLAKLQTFGKRSSYPSLPGTSIQFTILQKIAKGIKY